MGKRKSKAGKDAKDKKPRVDDRDKQNGGTAADRPDGYAPAVPRNARYETFYAAQGIITPNEWASYMATVATPLPVTFRISGDCPFRERWVRDRLDLWRLQRATFSGTLPLFIDCCSMITELSKHVGETMLVDDKEVQSVSPIAWYPGGLAFKLGCDKRRMRKHPTLATFYEWLQAHTESGTITRQEEVRFCTIRIHVYVYEQSYRVALVNIAQKLWVFSLAG